MYGEKCMRKFEPYLYSLIAIAVLAFYYFFAVQLHLRAGLLSTANAVIAFSSLFILGFSFILGPLAKFFIFFDKFLWYRKPFGLIGFGLAALHTLLVVFITVNSKTEVNLSDLSSLAFAGIAFMIFTLMALTSTQKWISSLGYENWKNLQRLGYLAILFVAFHVALLENGVFLTRITGQIAISFILLILFLRALTIVLGLFSKKKIKV